MAISGYLWITHVLLNTHSAFPISLVKEVSLWLGLVVTIAIPATLSYLSINRTLKSGKVNIFHKRAFAVATIILSFFLLLIFGRQLTTPPEIIVGSELFLPEAVETSQFGTVIHHRELENEEQKQWRVLEFKLSEKTPGSTPEYLISLMTSSRRYYSAMYNNEDSEVFFSFVPEIQYGRITSPPAGGWNQPLYVVKADDNVLNLLGIQSKE